MKKLLAAVFCFFCLGMGNAFAEEQVQDPIIKKYELDAYKDLSKLLVLDTENGKSRLYVYKRFGDKLICIKDSPAYIGKGGVTAGKIEGDQKTPQGLFGFLIAFGINENPGSLLPYYQVKKGDVWVTDPQSKYYNLFVRKNTVFVDWLSDIKLDQKTVRYSYALVIDYNISKREAYKGSAVFIECSIGKSTEGSIAVPNSFLKELLLFVDKDTKIYIH